jgi:hypothetical protein
VGVILKTNLDYTLNWTAVCNYALSRIGVGTIADLSEGSAAAAECNMFLPKAVRHLLAEYDWNFAKKRIRLARLVEKPLFGWENAFQPPVDMERLVGVYSEGESAGVAYAMEGGKLLSDADKIEIVYIRRPVTADELPFHFADALAAYLASLLAPVLTGSEQMIAMTISAGAEQIEKAKRQDAQMNYSGDFAGEPWYAEARA